MQVANAVSTYQTKSVERSALANTNLRIDRINTNLTGTNTALRTLISDRMQVANVNTLIATRATWTELKATNTAIRALITGGSASNSFIRISVSGQSDAVASSSQDRLTLVAGSNMTITTDAATDTITFASTGGSGTFTGGTVTGATTFTNATDSTSDATGAVKVTGGLGVSKNIYTAARMGFSSSSTSVAYTYYNSTTGSLDTVFG